MKTSNKLLLGAFILVIVLVTATIISLRTQGIIRELEFENEATSMLGPASENEDAFTESTSAQTVASITELKSTLLIKMLLPHRAL